MPVRDLLMSAGGASAPATYIEDVFITWLYAGNNSTQVINNGIDLSTKGGMVWTKCRTNAKSNMLINTVTSVNSALISNLTDATTDITGDVNSFNTTGYTLNTPTSTVNFNQSGNNFVSWTFRKQAKFFDIQTAIADSNGTVTFNHALGSTPGMVIVKDLTNSSNWYVYHTSTGSATNLLNSTGTPFGNYFTVSSTQVILSTRFSAGDNTVAYIFASNAGGFGATGTDNAITCGSLTTDGSGNATINLGYEAQYILVKRTDSSGAWYVMDIMRGFNQTNDYLLSPNTSSSESSYGAGYFTPTATGFSVNSYAPGYTFIYMAIRRPMKPPTTGTSVFSPVYSSASANTATSVGFPIDLQMDAYSGGDARNTNFNTRLIGSSSNSTYYSNFLVSSSTAAEQSYTGTYWIGSQNWNNTSFDIPGFYGGAPTIYYNFSRRPGFFDVVCYTGTGSATTQAHNLGVAPELAIFKTRSATSSWFVNVPSLGTNQTLQLNTTDAAFAYWNMSPSTTQISVPGSGFGLNDSGSTYVAYLFASCPGVSKVGSYTGNGGTQAISCGFTGGARFVLIKRTDSTGDWYVYDTARGMTTLIDPYLLLNSTSAQTATLGSVTTTTGGFTLNASILAAINTSGASYIFLAIA